MSKVVCEKLKMFYSVIELFSRTKYPTANLFFPNICEIKLANYRWSRYENNDIRTLATNMNDKFEKYWSVIHGIMAIATVLDPRYKMKLIEFYFPKIYGDHASYEIERIHQICYDLMKEYQLNSTHSREDESSIIHSLISSLNVDKYNDSLESFDLFVSSATTIDDGKSELDHYINQPILSRNLELDILSWWRKNGNKFLILQMIAREVLVILVSTVAFESTFSTGGRVVSPHRSRLHLETIEALMCSQDWLKKEIQDSTFSSIVRSSIFYDDYDDDDVDVAVDVTVDEG